ncbi:putative zinc-regulated transporter [Triangularia verruculosa]|uniref:Zinc-regulated transporter n=1 Tax=Triangularia verruculosa TaxID=2587418 RepID=A0AAN6XSW9_9PEZI|nr:putative zinc-regulated transporter [Triangularia verruculosa]
MFQRLPSIRMSVLYGLLAAPSLSLVSANPSPIEARHVVTDPAKVVAQATVTAVSECHAHGTNYYCQAGTTEFRIEGSETAASYTNCHGHGSKTYCVGPKSDEVEIILAAATDPAVTIAPTATGGPSLTAVSACHLHGSELLCMHGATEYKIHTTVTATATQDLPAQFTGCHAHGAETYCEGPTGEEVEITLAAAEDDHDDHDDADSGELNCHFHAGVEHCVSKGGEKAVATCEKPQRDYNIKLRVGLLFVMLATSSIAVFTPILISSFVSPNHIVFTILRQFGTGVIISTAFVHLYTHAVLMFQNECLGKLEYESTASAILMAGLFLSFLIEYIGIRFVQWHQAKQQALKSGSSDGEQQGPAPGKADMVNITVLEAGVIFHSLLIGLTVVVAGDSFFGTLFAVIVFHQMFEGIALGTRIAALGHPSSATAHAGVHSHGHGPIHAHYHPEPKPAAEIAATGDIVAHAAKEGHNHLTIPDAHKSVLSHNDSEDSAAAGELTPHVSMLKKLLLALAFALVTPIGMGIGIGALHQFNGNDPSTIIAIGTLDAFSAGILVWVGVVEMWAHDWMLGGEMTNSGPLKTALGLISMVVGLAVMSLLGKWA